MPPPIRKARAGNAGSSSEICTAWNSCPPNTPNNANSQAPDAAAFTVTLRPLPGTDGIRALRGLLKIALRRCRLRCVSCEETRR